MYEYSSLYILVFMGDVNSSNYYIHFISLLLHFKNMSQFRGYSHCKCNKYSKYLNNKFYSSLLLCFITILIYIVSVNFPKFELI